MKAVSLEQMKEVMDILQDDLEGLATVVRTTHEQTLAVLSDAENLEEDACGMLYLLKPEVLRKEVSSTGMTLFW